MPKNHVWVSIVMHLHPCGRCAHSQFSPNFKSSEANPQPYPPPKLHIEIHLFPSVQQHPAQQSSTDLSRHDRNNGNRCSRWGRFKTSKIRCRWCVLRRVERIFPARAGRRGILWGGSTSHAYSHRYQCVKALSFYLNGLFSDKIAVIRATHTQEVLGEQGRRIRELTSLIQKRFKFPENSVSLYAAKVQNRGLSAVAQCESLRYKLLNGLAGRRACYGVLRFIMESGAKGCEVVVSGKLRAARAKSMKFTVSIPTAPSFFSLCKDHLFLTDG